MKEKFKKILRKRLTYKQFKNYFLYLDIIFFIFVMNVGLDGWWNLICALLITYLYFAWFFGDLFEELNKENKEEKEVSEPKKEISHFKLINGIFWKRED